MTLHINGLSSVFYLLFMSYVIPNIIDISGAEEIVSRQGRNVPSLYYGSFDYCQGVGFSERVITKGSGSTVKLLESNTAVGLNWYQAAACCRSKGYNLININNEGDLKAYFNLRGGQWLIGWSDVHSFSNDWRNLRGVYPQGDVWSTPSKAAFIPNRCKEIGTRSHGGDSTTFHLFYELDCNQVWNEYLYCEDDDPLVPRYGCDDANKIDEKVLWTGQDNSKFYFENALKMMSNNVCVKPTTPPLKLFLSDDDFVPSKGKLTWPEASAKCTQSGLVLATVENQEDNEFLNNNRRLKEKPYNDKTRFWTDGKLLGSSYDDSQLTWSHSGKLFPRHNELMANGVNKRWDEPPVPNYSQGINCLGIRFPGITSYWAVADCKERHYYICMREPKDRNKGAGPARILNDEAGPTPLNDDDIVVSKGKLPWMDAIGRCQESGLVLASVENQEDNLYLSNNRRLKSSPYNEETRFWTAGRLKGSRFDDATLIWQSTLKIFPNHMSSNANGVIKRWSEPPIPKPNQGISCLDINFPTGSPSVWTISNCDQRRYYICMRTPEDRDSGNLRPMRINNDFDDYEPSKTQPKRPRPAQPDFDDYEPSKTQPKRPRPAQPDLDDYEPSRNQPKRPRPSRPDFDDYEPSKTQPKRPRPAQPDFDDYEPSKTQPKRPRPAQPDFDDYEPSKTQPKRPRPTKPDFDDYEPSKTQPKRPRPSRPDPVEQVKKPAPRPRPPPYIPKETSVSGVFIPDANPYQAVKGNMRQGEPEVFTPDNADEAIKRPTPGTFKPHESLTSDWPYSTLHGIMKPYSPEPGNSIFARDPLFYGVFKPDGGGKEFPGSMTQDEPAVFIPDSAPYITKPTPGIWKPNAGAIANHPCRTVHGVMRPVPGSRKEATFVPDLVRQGVFIPDGNTKKPIKGSLSQSNPPEFTPNNPSEMPGKRRVSGTWRPSPADPASNTHGILRPTKGGEVWIFVVDVVVSGIFIPDKNAGASIEGYLTIQSVLKIFFARDITFVFKVVIPGTWKPHPGQIGADNPKGMRGNLKPNPNILPPYSAFFVIDSPRPKRPPPPNTVFQEEFEEPEQANYDAQPEEEDCDPNLEQLGPKSKFYVSCRKAKAYKKK